MNLHNEIMNIQPRSKALAFKVGHTEAKQEAAELSLKAEARIEELELLLREAWSMVNGATEEWHNKVAEVLENKQ